MCNSFILFGDISVGEINHFSCVDIINSFPLLENFSMSILQNLHHFGSISSNYGSLTAAFIAAIILFIFKEYIKPPPKFSGVFYVKSTTIKSQRNPFKGMMLYHTFIVFSDGETIEGTSEKTAEKTTQQGDWVYPGKQRIRGVVTGKIQRRYLRPHIIHLHISEKGSHRESSHYIHLQYKQKGIFEGKFFSSAADSEGSIICQLKKFSDFPQKSSPCRYK